ncbi:MAG: tetratricopeptide repeat protein [Thermoplasmata archaeon]|nr:tetratricopeptide repeat protein [Thermoplasmata archaeon]
MVDLNIGMGIQKLMLQEMGAMGSRVLSEQCDKMKTRPEQIKTRDISTLSRNITRALSPVIGYVRAVHIGQDILRYKASMELEEAKAKPISAINQRREVDILFQLGSVSYQMGEWEEAKKHFKDAMRLAKSISYVLRTGECLCQIGHIHKEKSEWNSAIQNFENGLELSRSVNDMRGVADAYRGLGFVYWRKGDYARAIENYEKSIGIGKRIKEKGRIGVINLEFGNVYNAKGELEKAEEYYLRSLEFLKEVKDYEQMGRAYNNLGDIHLQREEWEEAIKDFKKCRESGEIINHDTPKGWALLNLGEALARLGKVDEAVASLDEALVILSKLDMKGGIAVTYRNYGVAYRYKKEWETANEYFEKAREELKELNSPYEEGHLYYEWGSMWKDAWRDKESEECLERSLGIFKKLGAKKFAERAKKALEG